MADGTLILVAGALLVLGIAASLVAGRLRVPGLVLFLGVGMLLGSDVLGLIDFGGSREDVELARTIGVVALALILFEGGLAAGFKEIRPVLGTSVSLAIVGTLVTAAVVGFAVSWLLDLSTLEGLLLGSIVAATDSAAIFSVLRGSSLDRRLARILEGESGLNDSVGIVLVLAFIEYIQQPDFGPLDVLVLTVTELGIGVGVGLVVGRLAVMGFQRARISTTGLYPVASIAAAALAFGLADVLHGSGFISVYIAGLTLGSATIPARRTIDDFHDGLAWVSQIAVFLTLGLLVNPGDLGEIAGVPEQSQCEEDRDLADPGQAVVEVVDRASRRDGGRAQRQPCDVDRDEARAVQHVGQAEGQGRSGDRGHGVEAGGRDARPLEAHHGETADHEPHAYADAQLGDGEDQHVERAEVGLLDVLDEREHEHDSHRVVQARLALQA